MVEIEDIVDMNSLEEWLSCQSQRFSLVVAYRSAMRGLPLYINWSFDAGLKFGGSGSLVSMLRSLLISNAIVFETMSELTRKYQHAAKYALRSADHNLSACHQDALGSMSDFVSGFADASDSTIFAAESYACGSDFDISSVAAGAVVNASEYTPNAWGAVKKECKYLKNGGDDQILPLWPQKLNPVSDEWEIAKGLLELDDANWSFWVKWYESALNGVPINHSVLERVSLLPTDAWEKNSTHLNEVIAEIATVSK